MLITDMLNNGKLMHVYNGKGVYDLQQYFIYTNDRHYVYFNELTETPILNLVFTTLTRFTLNDIMSSYYDTMVR